MTARMYCSHCNRRIAKAYAMTVQGPVGPVCAVNLGVAQLANVKARVRMFGPRRSGRSKQPEDSQTMDWIRGVTP